MPKSASEVPLDETPEFAPNYDAAGLIGAIVQDVADNRVLMFAHMNAAALAATRTTGLIHFWSRSRGKLWMKGETSGETFRVVDIRVDCDQDCLLLQVTPQGKGKACHTGRRSCFYRSLPREGAQLRMMD
jgi:phosphoribosyl-AMP cyclohydrolase